MKKKGITITTGGTILVLNKKKAISFPPLKEYLERANAAGILIIKVRIVVPKVTMILLTNAGVTGFALPAASSTQNACFLE
tara:strand:+ start:2759 stop:3001 length:243 start_codon:yes stop_codon:yes gene_type:complete